MPDLYEAIAIITAVSALVYTWVVDHRRAVLETRLATLNIEEMEAAREQRRTAMLKVTKERGVQRDELVITNVGGVDARHVSVSQHLPLKTEQSPLVEGLIGGVLPVDLMPGAEIRLPLARNTTASTPFVIALRWETSAGEERSGRWTLV